MVPPRRISAWAAAIGSLGLTLAPAASAQQDVNSDMDALKKRVSDLEAKMPKDAAAAADMKWGEFSLLGSKFKFYGFLRLDMYHDSMRPNNTTLPVYVRTPDPAAPAGFRAPKNDGDFTMNVKLTRFAFDLTGPTIGGLNDAQVLGKLETDFYNTSTSDSRQALRIRLAYLQLKWTSFNLYAGQMWDLISPLQPIVNPDNVMWGTGNLADRRPQLRGEWIQPMGESKLNLSGMIGETGAIDNQDLDPAGTTGNGYLDGTQSEEPTFQARIGWKVPMIGNEKKKEFEAGVWAHHAKEQTDTAIGSSKHFMSSAYGFDVTLPVYEDVVWIKTEWWHGRNMDDVRGGILQGVNTAGQEIVSSGGFGEVGFKAHEHVSVYGGYSTDNPNNDDLINSATNAARARNRVYYGALRFDFKPVYFGLDYLYWITNYKGFDDGIDHRIQAYIQYSF